MNHQSSDSELIQQLQAGKRMALSILYDRYAQPLYYFFLKLFFQDANKAEDFVQDLFMKIIEDPQRLDAQKNLKAWLFTAAHNMAKNEFRHLSIKQKHVEETLAVSENTISHEEELNLKFNKQELSKGLKELKPAEQALLIMRFKENFAIKDIAEILSIPEGTVKSRIHHCLKKIASHLSHLNPNRS